MEKYRENLVEKACEQDEEVLEQYLETGEAPDVATLKKCIRKGTLTFSYLVGVGGLEVGGWPPKGWGAWGGWIIVELFQVIQGDVSKGELDYIISNYEDSLIWVLHRS